jgi:glycosyltransferase involved in cell wall biosynthesis
MPKISVIIPAYNVEKHIEKCINSVLNQSYRDFEIIFIDDKSLDRTKEIAVELLKSQTQISFKTILKERNEGISSARNTGIENASGKYVLFIDSDDWIDKEMLQVLIDSATSANAEIVVSRVREVHESNHKSRILKSANPGVISGAQAVLELFSGTLHAHICKMLFSRSLFVNIRFPVGIVYEDMLIVPYILARAKKVCFIDDVMYNYLQRLGSITKSFNPNIIKVCNELRKMKDDFSYLRGKGRQASMRYIYLNYLILVEQAAILSPNYEMAELVLLTCRNDIKTPIIYKQFTYKPSGSMLLLLLLKISPKLFYKRYK